MKKIPQESSNLIAANRQNLKQIFPEIFCEDQIDFQNLKQLLGEKIIDDETQENQTQEKYGLNWSGKSQARQFALSTSLATLRPKKSDSVNWQNTKNLMIEGDNLEVLKLLQKSYAAKIKMIYIDPPYNTGKDFVYPDDYTQSIQNYKKILYKLMQRIIIRFQMLLSVFKERHRFKQTSSNLIKYFLIKSILTY
jgi:adenine-specific DNA-methyltransferase